MKRKLKNVCLCLAVLFCSAGAFAAPVPDTGQTKCYDVAGNVITCPSPGQELYGQDANYSINPMSYTLLNGMVKDNVTGLIWESKTNKDAKRMCLLLPQFCVLCGEISSIESNQTVIP